MINEIKFPKAELHFDYTFNGGQAFRYVLLTHSQLLWFISNDILYLFRWKSLGDGKWMGVFSHSVWKLWQDNDTIFYEVYKSSKSSQDNEKTLREYLRLDEPLSSLYEEWSECDRMFKEAAKKFTGVRMLKQDPVEIIFTFICSSNNNIAR